MDYSLSAAPIDHDRAQSDFKYFMDTVWDNAVNNDDLYELAHVAYKSSSAHMESLRGPTRDELAKLGERFLRIMERAASL
jgi:hypothetical protein